ncbi:FAD/NAD(P)-binding protein [Promicromonospora sukumoe]|uniref:FAD/NAD(P)-binding protein n=1 Tax=Promicromonospora sukumoe TaxID=88382 RepID=UPI0003719B5B|nr:FAD/NAD(P)-binding protein [Promicromonospora sukumoe]
MQRTIAVIGGGAAGVILSAHLLRAAAPFGPERSVRVVLVDPAETPGRGLPYRTTDPRHTLNAVVARLSAFDDDPEHLLRWCASAGVPAEPGTFLQRADFGRYLTELLDGVPVPAGSEVRHVRGTVVDVTEIGDGAGVADGARATDGGVGGGALEGPDPADAPGVLLTLADGGTLRADAAVLALGTPPPVRLPEYEPWGDRYVADPWSPDLDDRAAGARRVLVVGTGLTTLDVVAHLHALLPQATFTAVSRGGALPAAHAKDPLPPAVEVDLDVRPTGSPTGTPVGTLAGAVDQVRQRVADERAAGRDWRAVIDAVRPQVNLAWAGLTPEEQATFQREHARSWENVRHRMSHAMRSHVDQLRADGVLTLGTVAEVRGAHPGAGDGWDTSAFDLVVGATGLPALTSPGWNPLVDALLARGLVRPHRLGTGLDLTADAALVDTAGVGHPRLRAMGLARRGLEWECTSVPDLRRQAAQLADDLLG